MNTAGIILLLIAGAAIAIAFEGASRPVQPEYKFEQRKKKSSH